MADAKDSGQPGLRGIGARFQLHVPTTAAVAAAGSLAAPRCVLQGSGAHIPAAFKGPTIDQRIQGIKDALANASDVPEAAEVLRSLNTMAVLVDADGKYVGPHNVHFDVMPEGMSVEIFKNEGEVEAFAAKAGVNAHALLSDILNSNDGIAYDLEGECRSVARLYLGELSDVSQDTLVQAISNLGEKPYGTFFSFIAIVATDGRYIGPLYNSQHDPSINTKAFMTEEDLESFAAEQGLDSERLKQALGRAARVRNIMSSRHAEQNPVPSPTWPTIARGGPKEIDVYEPLHAGESPVLDRIRDLSVSGSFSGIDLSVLFNAPLKQPIGIVLTEEGTLERTFNPDEETVAEVEGQPWRVNVITTQQGLHHFAQISGVSETAINISDWQRRFFAVPAASDNTVFSAGRCFAGDQINEMTGEQPEFGGTGGS